MTTDEFLALIDYPVHETTFRVAINGERGAGGLWRYHPMEREEATKLSRKAMWLAKLRKATNGKYGRYFGDE